MWERSVGLRTLFDDLMDARLLLLISCTYSYSLQHSISYEEVAFRLRVEAKIQWGNLSPTGTSDVLSSPPPLNTTCSHNVQWISHLILETVKCLE